MSRSVDICTCGRERVDHGNATHEFFPHPQPMRAPEKTLQEKVRSFLESMGTVRDGTPAGFYHVKLSDGELWTVDVTLRRTARNSEGV